MSKNTSVDEFMSQVQDVNWLLGEQVVFAMDHKSWKAGTPAVVNHVFVLNTDLSIYVVVQPEGATDDDVASVEATFLSYPNGTPLPTKASLVNGELQFPATTQNGDHTPMTTELMTPQYPQAQVDPVTAIFQSFAPGQPIAAEFQQFYQGQLGTDPNYLQQVMAAYGVLSTQWSPQQTAQLYAAVLTAYQQPTPDHVAAIASGQAPAPVAPAPVPQALPPSPMPVPAQALAPMPVEHAPQVIVNPAGGLPVVAGMPGVPPMPSIPTAVSMAPAVQPLPPAPAGEPVAEAPPAKTRGGKGKSRAKKVKAEGETAGKLTLDQLAALEALLKVYALDPDGFDANLDAALDALNTIV